MKINLLFFKITVVVTVIFLAMPLFCGRTGKAIDRRLERPHVTGGQPQAPRPAARPAQAPQRPANNEDAELQAAIAMSLASSTQAAAPTARDENDERILAAVAESLETAKEQQDRAEGKLNLSQSKIDDIMQLPVLFEGYSQELEKTYASLMQKCQSALHPYINNLAQDARKLLPMLQSYVDPLFNAAAEKVRADFEQLELEMIFYKKRFQLILHSLQSLLRMVGVKEQPQVSDFPIPASLAKPDFVIRHLRTGGQKGATCGGHATINARAVQQVLESNEQVTSKTMQAKAEALQGYIQRENLSDYEIYCLTQQVGLHSGFVFALNKNIGSFYEINRAAAMGANKGVNEIFSMIQNSPAGDYYFVLNTGGHWITVAIIKSLYQLPQVLVLDSGNSPLEEGSIGTQFIKYLLNSIFNANI